MSMPKIPIRRREHTVATTARLLSPAPLQQLLERLRIEHATMARLTPNADAVATIGVIVSDLASAIECAADVNVFMTTLTRLCRHHGAKIGATKIAGSWSIHWPTFEKYFSSGSKEPFREEAA